MKSAYTSWDWLHLPHNVTMDMLTNTFYHRREFEEWLEKEALDHNFHHGALFYIDSLIDMMPKLERDNYNPANHPGTIRLHEKMMIRLYDKFMIHYRNVADALTTGNHGCRLDF